MGLNSEWQLLLRLARRFGAAVVERSRVLLQRIVEPAVLGDLGGDLLGCAAGVAGSSQRLTAQGKRDDGSRSRV